MISVLCWFCGGLSRKGSIRVISRAGAFELEVSSLGVKFKVGGFGLSGLEFRLFDLRLSV